MTSKRTNHISVVMNDEERDRLDGWMDRQEPRIRSRSEAIRRLIEMGLDVAEGKTAESEGVPQG